MVTLLCVVAACGPSAPTPTPTPEPTPTPVEVLATKPQHLEGVWFNPYYGLYTSEVEGRYYLFGADGTIYGRTLEEVQEKTWPQGEFWFDDGVYYENGQCDRTISYRVYLHIEEGRAVRLRFEEMDHMDPTCVRRFEMRILYERVD